MLRRSGAEAARLEPALTADREPRAVVVFDLIASQPCSVPISIDTFDGDDLPGWPHQRHEADGDGALLNDAGGCPRNEQDVLIGDAYGNDHAPADLKLIHQRLWHVVGR